MVAIIESAIVLILLISIILPKMKICKVGEYSEDYLSLENTNALRGLMAVLIVLHHLSGYYSQLTFLSPFQHIGYIIVAVFFFLSGYGLFYGFEHKNNYLNKFLLKRLPNIIIPYYICNCFYAVILFIFNMNIEFKNFLLSFVGINYIIPGSWYIVMQVVMYILFYISFKVLKNSDYNKQIALFFALFVVIFVLFLIFVDSDLYIRSILAFPIGIFWGKYKTKIDALLKKHYVIVLVFITLFQILAFGVKFGGEYFSVDKISFIGSLISSSIFPIFVMILLNKITIKNAILTFFGNISLEMYLIHNIVLIIVSKNQFVINHSLLFTLISFAITICISFAFNKINRQFIPKFIKIITK